MVDVEATVAPNRLAALLLAFHIFQSFFTTGIVYGWPALLLVLQSDGVFRNRCSEHEPDCDSRTVAFNLVFTAGGMANVGGALVIGQCVDLLGPKLSMISGLLITIMGSLLFAFSHPDDDLPWVIGYVAFGLGGAFVHLGSFSIGNAFGKAKGTVVTILVLVFSISALTFQLGDVFYSELGISRRALFLGHAGIEAFNLIVASVLWPSYALRPNSKLEFKDCTVRAVNAPVSEDSKTADAQADAEHSQRCKRVCAVATSAVFLRFVCFHCVQLWISRCLMGWMPAELAWKKRQILDAGGDSIDVAAHLTFFNVCQAALGILAIPAFGVVAKRNHHSATFLATNLLGALWLAVLLVPAEWALYLVHFISPCHRQFFFSTFFTFIISEFPVDLFATLAGLANFVAGLLTYSQNPILDAVLADLDGDFIVPLCAQLGIVLLLFALPVVDFFSRRQRDHKQDAHPKCSDQKQDTRSDERGNTETAS